MNKTNTFNESYRIANIRDCSADIISVLPYDGERLSELISTGHKYITYIVGKDNLPSIEYWAEIWG